MPELRVDCRQVDVRKVTRTIGFLISLSLLSSCGGDTPTGPTTDFIAIDSIVPAAGTVLVAGERVTFTVAATCTIVSADGGFTVLIVQDQRNMLLGLFDTRPPEAACPRGTTKVTLTETITVPSSGSTVNALLPIFAGSSTETRAVAVRTYTVR